MSESTDQFIESRRRDLLKKRQEIQQTLEMNTEEFNELLRDVETKDYPEIAEETRDKSTLGRVQLIEWEQVRNISSALHRIEQGSYGRCQVCDGTISRERLVAIPEATLCVECEARWEAAAERR